MSDDPTFSQVADDQLGRLEAGPDVDLYNAVARVLAFVLALRKRGSSRGVHEMNQLVAAGGH